jgi:hypothetical protein
MQPMSFVVDGPASIVGAYIGKKRQPLGTQVAGRIDASRFNEWDRCLGMTLDLDFHGDGEVKVMLDGYVVD